MPQKIIIVGGVGGGATVAAQIRRTDKDSEILLFEKCGYISFANCGMPYHIGGTVEKRDTLLYPVEKFAEKYQVHVHTNTEVTSINREHKTIQYEVNGTNYEASYDKLIVSPGATPIVPNAEGIANSRTFTLRTIEDMDRINEFISNFKPKKTTIIGGGFIGLEMLENLHALGLHCTIIDRSPQLLKNLDADMAEIIEDYLKDKHIDVIVNDGLEAFEKDGKTLVLNSGKKIHTDMTILAIGIKPNTKLATEASLELGNSGAIAVNAYMQTSDSDIYALGDAVEVRDFLTGSPKKIALAWPAHRQAYIISSHLNGNPVPYKGNLGSAILKVFDLTVATTGHNSATLKEEGRIFKHTFLATYSHAAYYPGSEKLWIKLFFNGDTGLLYGANVVGFDGVDKRMAVLATAIKGKLTVHDLPELELGYSPAYSSSKDPINVIGYKAQEMLAN
ncbi:CoA-disulfide reductase [Oceanobacillus saliphilus]|uniref:CoA-disulfide reductase n=1 Tax=Oceanobacillus saliphilus TaxID=2925834 RepID=UPI00201E670E|nr:CoA-disulfide reductase [Oceanobacillus saliphilus]